MEVMFENRLGQAFPHTTESWDETLDLARLHGFGEAAAIEGLRPGMSLTDGQAEALAGALEAAVREDLGEHSVLADFAELLRGGGVVVGTG